MNNFKNKAYGNLIFEAMKRSLHIYQFGNLMFDLFKAYSKDYNIF